MFSGKVVHLPLKEFSDSNAMQNAENRTVAKTLPLFLQYYAKATNIQIVEINQPLFKIKNKLLIFLINVHSDKVHLYLLCLQ